MSPEQAYAELRRLVPDEADEVELAVLLDDRYSDMGKGAILAVYWFLTGRRDRS